MAVYSIYYMYIIYNSERIVSDVQTRAEGESLYIRYTRTRILQQFKINDIW